MNNSPILSSCCHKPVHVEGNVTHYHVCEGCERACDLASEMNDSLLNDIHQLLLEDRLWRAKEGMGLKGYHYNPDQLAENLATLCQTYAMKKSHEVLQFCAERTMIRADLKEHAFRSAFPPAQ